MEDKYRCPGIPGGHTGEITKIYVSPFWSHPVKTNRIMKVKEWKANRHLMDIQDLHDSLWERHFKNSKPNRSISLEEFTLNWLTLENRSKNFTGTFDWKILK